MPVCLDCPGNIRELLRLTAAKRLPIGTRRWSAFVTTILGARRYLVVEV